MNKSIGQKFRRLIPCVLLLLFLAPLLFVPPWHGGETGVSAQDPPPIAGPGWQMSPGEQVTPEESQKLLEVRGAAMGPLAMSTSETEATPEILALARALKNDPRLIFDYVHNTIDYIPIYGSLNGATATIYARRGNDWDQASLFIALMRAAGYQARYVVGNVTYPTDRLANWVGLPANAVQNAFQNGGVPWAWGTQPNTIRLARTWAQAQISGTWYTFDPAMKEYQDTAGLSGLNSILGYNSSTFMSRAQSGATVTADSALNINETNIRADLTTYSSNLVGYLRTNLPTAGAAQVIGARSIVLTEMTGYATTVPYGTVSGTPQTMDAVSNAYRHTMRVQYNGIDRTFFTFEIAARRTTLFYDDVGGGSYAPVLRVDATSIATGTPAITNTTRTMTVTVDHPYAGSSGTFADQEAWFSLTYGRGSYALVHDFNTVSPLLIARHNDLLGQALFQGLPGTSEAVRGGSLWATGLSWMRQVDMYDHMVDRLNHTLTLTHHRVGIVGQQDGFFIDMPLAFSSGTSTDGTSDVFLSARMQTMLDSAFEHGILKQLQDHGGFDSVSTIRMLQFSNSQHTKTFLAKSSNWSTGTNVRSQLSDYDPSDLAWFDTLIAAGYELLLPQDGDQAVDAWSGVGYIQRKQTAGGAAMGMIINGGYGGYTSQPVTINSRGTQEYQYLWNQWDPPYIPQSKDPVNMLTGAFLYENTDLTIGPAQEPLGLSLARAYNSGSAYIQGPLGYGWTHNYQWSARLHSSGDAGLGAGSGIDAAALVAYTQVALDVLANQLNVQGWTTTAVATKWAMDQLTDNAVTVQANNQTSAFIKLANGSYNPSAGGSDLLTLDGAGYHLQDRFGARYEFDLSGKITSWKDANDNTMTFAYNGLSQLTQVTDAWGNALAFAYGGNLITSVSNAGRSVGFTYTGSQLTACTDPAGAIWRYAYDSDNRMTQVFKANSTTVALTTNVYDEFGRVKEQTDALGNKTQFYFSGYRNVERFPDSGEVVYFFASGLFRARQDQAGTRTTFSYNGLGQLVSVTDRLTGASTFTYHAQTGRLAAVTNGRGKTTTYTYAVRGTNLYDLSRIDHPDGAYEQFTYNASGDLLTWRDTGGGTWTYTYNARGQVLTVRNPTAGTLTYTYNADGTLASVVDSDAGMGTITYSYDTHKRLTQIAYPGGANEQFIYDLADRLTQYTDRLGTVYTYTHDAGGSLTGLTRAQGLGIAQSETYQYDDMGHHTTTIDPASQQTQFAYNNLGSLSQITYPGGATVALGYDSRRWINRVTDAAGYIWQATRDSESVPNSVTTPESRLVNLGSDTIGSYTQITDAAGKTASAERDAMDRVIKVVDRLNRTTTIGRNSAGRITSITMPIIGTVSYTRNTLGLVTRITDPLGNYWDFAYTAMGRISQVKDPKGNTWTYTYDALGRVRTITYPDTVVETRTYDNNDNLTGRQFTSGLNLTFTYDPLNRLTATGSTPVAITYGNRSSIVNTQMGGANWGATYNARGRVATVTYDGQMTVSYSYDLRGLLTQVSDTKTSSWIKLYYDKDSLLIKLERSNGIHTEFTRDANGRITKIKHGDKGEMNLTYDAEDQITQIIESLPLDVASFIQPELIEYSYDDANQINSAGFSYDARGRRTADPRRAYTWDAADRLTRIVEGATTVDLEYTALGEVSRRIASGVATDYFYNYAIADHPIMAEKRSSAYTRFYVYTPGGRLLYFVDTPIATPAARFYHFNHLGSTLFLTNAAGAVADTYGYTPFGHLVKHIGSSDQIFTFVGEYGVRQEGESGLYHMRARYYDSRTIQFLSRDSLWPDLEDPKSLNPYQYAGQNPLSFIDPSGLTYYVDGQGNPMSLSEVDKRINFGGNSGALVGEVNDMGHITWFRGTADGPQRLANGSLPTTIEKLRLVQRGNLGEVQKTQEQAIQKPSQVTRPPAPTNLGYRESSSKSTEMLVQGQPGSMLPRESDNSTKWRIETYNRQSNSNGCCCSNCSLLDTGAAPGSPLAYLLGPLIGLLALGAIWFGLRRFVANRP